MFSPFQYLRVSSALGSGPAVAGLLERAPNALTGVGPAIVLSKHVIESTSSKPFVWSLQRHQPCDVGSKRSQQPFKGPGTL